MPLRLFYILLILGIVQNTQAQPSIADSSASVVIDIYYHVMGEQSPLYNGSEYIETSIALQEGHVFFESDVFIKGTIWFDGMLFRDVPILYDILKDQVIVQHYNHVFKIRLPAEKIGYFTLPGHYFIYIQPDSFNRIKAGFYEKLTNGKTMLVVRHEKKIKEEHTTSQINNIIVSENAYYIKKEGIYYAIKNMHSLLNILKNKKKEIQQYLSKNNIKTKKDPEQAMLLSVEYYDRITN